MTKDRLDIGRQVYEHLLTKEDAARKYGASVPCIYVDLRAYMRSIGIEPLPKGTKRVEPAKGYRSMTKDELMLKGIEVARLGTPTDNGTMEATNGWIKPEMLSDFRIGESGDTPKSVADYIRFFNEERPSYALGYLAPAQFKAKYAGKPDRPKKPSKIAYERKKERIEKANQK